MVHLRVGQAVRCNKNTKSESYSQYCKDFGDVDQAVRCNKNTKSESYSQSDKDAGVIFGSCALQQKY